LNRSRASNTNRVDPRLHTNYGNTTIGCARPSLLSEIYRYVTPVTRHVLALPGCNYDCINRSRALNTSRASNTSRVEVHRSSVNAEHRPIVRPKASAQFG